MGSTWGHGGLHGLHGRTGEEQVGDDTDPGARADVAAVDERAR